jgi:hypothetical protein
MSTPWEMLTGRKENWSKLKVFGCDVFEFIANEKFTKVPEFPRGREILLAPHTSGPRDVPRCGALSLLQKDAALQGGSSRNRCKLNVKMCTSVTD